MARVVGSLLGELRGKLGGNVFSRNKSGAIIRQYVKPVSPNTVAQVNARAGFGQAGSLWATLSAAYRAYWGEFAESIFRPKNSTNIGQYTGQQAFQSLNSVIAKAVNSQNPASLPTIEVNGAPLLSGVTFAPFSFQTTDPPAFSIQSSLAGSSGGSYPVTLLETSEVTETGQFRAVLRVSNGEGVGLFNFQDSNQTDWGLVGYMSDSNNSEGMSYSNPEKYCLGYIEPFQATDAVTDLASVETIEATKTAFLNLIDYKQFPYNGQFVMFTLYAVSSTGTLIRLGAVELQVSAVLS